MRLAAPGQSPTEQSALRVRVWVGHEVDDSLEFIGQAGKAVGHIGLFTRMGDGADDLECGRHASRRGCQVTQP
ncbi:MAG: hypothetical protein EB027_02295 [Actinobacteria bacterium]|nr:hypothetical protein [Actinomycetota bacterium]